MVTHARDHLLEPHARAAGARVRRRRAARRRGRAVGVLGAHFGLRAEERRRHAAEVAAIADRLRAAGRSRRRAGRRDLNSKPHAGEWAAVVRVGCATPCLRRDAAWSTFPARRPTARIDVVLAETGRRGGRLRRLPEHADVAGASDHRPVLAVLRRSRGRADPGGPLGEARRRCRVRGSVQCS